jgi:hypothetical protein
MGAFGLNEMVLLCIDGSRITEVHRLCPGTKRCEKNWLPLVKGDELLILYSTDPTIWLRVDPSTMKGAMHSTTIGALSFDHQRGGTNLIDEGEFMYLAHEAIDVGNKRTYLHRIHRVDRDNLSLASSSEPFFFEERGIVEFASGLARVGDELFVGFGRKDEEAKLCVMKDETGE